MTGLISPKLSRLTALALLAFGVWAIGGIAVKFVLERVAIEREVSDLRRSYAQIQSRRVDIASLEAEVFRLSTSPRAAEATIVAATERAAAARLQQVVRGRVQAASGQLLSLSEPPPGAKTTGSSVGVQIRARIAERNLDELIASLEGQAPRLGLFEVTLAARPRAVGTIGDVDVSMVARAGWTTP